jgi:membrane protein DedA with SNARE-associated domain
MAPAPSGVSLAGIDRGQPAPVSEKQEAKHVAHGPSHHGIMGYVEGDIAKVQPFLIRYGYAALSVAILVEGFGIPAPGQTLLMAASIDAARGKLNIAWVLAFALAAAVSGNAMGYAIGRWGGHPLLKRLKVNESRLARMERRFARSGTGLLLAARFFDGLRQLNAIVAGLLEMPWRKFALWSTLGAMLWTGVWGLGIYFLGRKMAFLHHIFRDVEPVILALAAAAAATLLLYLLWQRRNRKS